jgi:hypothetical protein
LKNNYPNPFNGTTKIIYKINKDDRYNMELFDITGKRIENIFDKYIKRGEYEINYSADKLSSGIYFIKLSSNANNKTIKIILNK